MGTVGLPEVMIAIVFLGTVYALARWTVTGTLRGVVPRLGPVVRRFLLACAVILAVTWASSFFPTVTSG